MIDQFGEDHPHLARRRDRQGGTGAAVAWMVSNCLTESNRCRVLEAGGGEEECLNLHTPREGFVETLRQYVEVDVFGPCYQDSQQCGKESAGDCWDLLASRCMVQSFILSSCHAPHCRYKFYLSLENSLCTDYVTEKFWEPLRRDIVPVVLGTR